MQRCKKAEIVFENLDYIEINPENIKFLELGDFDLDIERNGMFARADIVKKMSFVISHKEQKAIDRILKQKDLSKISILYENSHDYIYTNWIGSFIEKSFLRPKRGKENPLQTNQILENGDILITIGED